MVLIILRIRAHIPVVVMGETGCGKTSLVKFLSIVAGVEFAHMDFHAGITEQHIIDFVSTYKALALASPHKSFWLFFDEINTCDHLGLITELICHRSMLGVPLPHNLCLIAACNPYRMRTKQTLTSGLEGKVKWDDLSKLVYRVHPLPEALMDYVWDYGTLNSNDEKAYISSIMYTTFPRDLMTHTLSDLLSQTVYFSQRYIREVESPESVSMRDVKRCRTLITWFFNNPKIAYDPTTNIKRAIVLGLAHCYYCRLCTTEERKKYRDMVSDIFRDISTQQFYLQTDEFAYILLEEQQGYLGDMELPEGIAPNSALLENVFVVMVCILNKVPVFVVGKPGCSKSLSLQLINSNLRGLDSKSAFFQRLPQVFVIAYQGSESSTSDGILKVFEKAHKYVEHNKGVIPVVLLDEVGLAEISKYNPLKVLHGLLEPSYPKDTLDVAVVGISNWALDSAKMNRAIHLSRPEPDVYDLSDTGKAIQRMMAAGKSAISESNMLALAKAYHEYTTTQTHKNFHGLRDYYALIKCLSRGSNEDEIKALCYALERNFGGLPQEMGQILDIFLKQVSSNAIFYKGMTVQRPPPTPVLELIRGNLADRTARHLMVISSGDSVVGILERYLHDSGEGTKSENYQAPFVIFGSKFPEDRSEEYRYRVLSKIILCMETGRTVILKDLEDIYGSLYDMLNQNYTYVGKKKNCRIALGAYSNPMCNVHDNFRCIVLVDHKKLDFTDPPFLNRFEKQMILFEDVLDKNAHPVAILEKLKRWATQISSASGFTEPDMFMGFHEDTLASAALLHSVSNTNPAKAIERAKEDMMWIATPDGFIRVSNAQPNAKELREAFFTKHAHTTLAHFLQAATNDYVANPIQTKVTPKSWGDLLGIKVAVMTHSSIHANISNLVAQVFPRQVHQVFRIGAFTSEKQLTNCIRGFFTDPVAELFVLQVDTQADAPHVLLAKSILDQLRIEFFEQMGSAYAKSEEKTGADAKPSHKHLVIVFHVTRAGSGSGSDRWQLNYQSGWHMVAIDTLEPTPIPLESFFREPVVDLVKSEFFPLDKIISEATSKLKLPHAPKTTNSSEELIGVVTRGVLEWLTKRESKNWYMVPICNKALLYEHNTLYNTLFNYLRQSVVSALNLLVSGRENDFVSYFNCENEELRNFWETSFLKLTDIGTNEPSESWSNRFPFGWLFLRQLGTLKNVFLEDTARLEAELEDGADEESDDETNSETNATTNDVTENEEVRAEKAEKQKVDQTRRFREMADRLVDPSAMDVIKQYLPRFTADYRDNMIPTIPHEDRMQFGIYEDPDHPIDLLLMTWRYELLVIAREEAKRLEEEEARQKREAAPVFALSIWGT